ncbi:type II CRISPR RNA-guided endonuclease Cas9 [Capnocytophaga canis]|uniref:type II CRISPR RNA-guided endonuclease Cas9 n=1 Tax=Capnocytophaga canis TaxID=1848903 RepID=UPI0015620595
MKTILGLDLGTNSIGWALIERNIEEKYGKIIGMGSRIIPMSQDILGKFDAGQSISQTAERTGFRSTRKLYQRDNLRRERLHRVLNILGFLPTHYANAIDFEKRLGQFKENQEPKLPYAKNEEDKFEFIFKSSFEEMVADFRKQQPQLFYTKPNGKESQIPYDWTIYYLRKKALNQKLSKEELAWLLLHFNQKRGYYQLRGEDEQADESKSIKFYALKVVKVEEDGKDKKGDTWYNVHLENGWVYRRTSKNFLDWEGKVREFIVTEKLNEDGTIKVDKEGKEDRSFKAVNSEEDWIAIKKSTEDKINHSEKTVGAYIYDTLLQEPNQKIRGKLIRTIERKFYKDELIKILKKQIELQPEIFTKALYKACIEELYTHNEAHRKSISDRGFVYLFVDDIIFYQRPLKSKKSLIAKCSLEERSFVVEENGKREEKIEGIKCIAKTNPIYQEFRVLQWMYNLKIYEKFDNKDVTSLFISSIEDKENLFEFLMNQKEVNHKHILDYFVTQKVKNEFPNAKPKAFKEEVKRQMALYRWNYVYDEVKDESKTYPMNETGYEIRKRFEKVTNLPVDFYTKEKEYYLWHLIYSVTDKLDFEKALKKYAIKYGLDIESFVESFKNIKPYPSEYGGFSEKAIKKLLPLMRFGKFWDFNQISKAIQSRIQFIINGEFSEDIPLNVREQVFKFQLNKEADFQGLPLWLAQYVVYNRHSESSDLQKWTSVEDLQEFLKNFRQHSLRNPIVEQIVTETLRVVRDVWQSYGNGEKDFFSEIHIEMGRELKKTAEERNDETKKNNKNEATNLRLKALLMEMANDPKVENVRPYSPSQLEILKIYEEGVLGLFSEDELKKEGDKKDEIYIISKKSEPTKSELQRYKLWLEQKYQSPYTGEIIPLNKLFTDNYQIEHIIPQSKFFDDSFSNKVICESAVNGLKDNQLGFEFIKNHHGEKIQIGDKIVTIFSEEQYKDFVSKTYANNRVKREKLLMEEIPEKIKGVKMKCTITHKPKKPEKALKIRELQPKKPENGNKTKCTTITINYYLITI